MDSGTRHAGYLALYPGALASVGNLRSDWTDDQEHSRKQLASLARELFQLAFQQGAEMVQAIAPVIPARMSENQESEFISSDPNRDEALRAAGMVPIATLVQMECFGMHSFHQPTLPSTLQKFGNIRFVPFHEIPSEQWRELVESTYIGTLDVPELNGLRNTESTLRGYASGIQGNPKTWWVVTCESENVGCVLVTPTGADCCELTYVGLVPQWRGKGLSKSIMNFVRDWAMNTSIQGIHLAVDIRNTPAIRLYQSCGFMAERFVKAWVSFPKG